MLIRYLKTMAGPHTYIKAGRESVVDDDKGRRLIASGLAVELTFSPPELERLRAVEGRTLSSRLRRAGLK